MNTPGFLASLNLGTLVLVFLLAVAGFAFFLRKRRNRHPLEGKTERNVARDLDADRAAPEELPRR